MLTGRPVLTGLNPLTEVTPAGYLLGNSLPQGAGGKVEPPAPSPPGVRPQKPALRVASSAPASWWSSMVEPSPTLHHGWFL